MGLDMYLDRYPKIGSYRDACVMEDYFDWLESKYRRQGFQFYGEYTNDDVRFDLLDQYKDELKVRYSVWDEEKKFGGLRITENVAYWRKANAIHRWFVDRVQDGNDDMSLNHSDVTKEDVVDLLEICKSVLNSSVMIRGKVSNGYSVINGVMTKDEEDGLVIANPEVAEELLPTESGFFFGSTDYDEGYMQDIAETIVMLEKVLEETDFEKYGLHYVASW